MKRRHGSGVKMAETPQTQHGTVPGLSSPHVGKRCSHMHPASRRQRRVAVRSVVLELGNSHTAYPPLGGHEHARVREGGRRQRRSQTPRRHDGDTVKVCQAWYTAPTEPTRTWGMLTKGSLRATSDLMALAGSLHRRAVSNHQTGKRSALKGARSVWKGGKDCKVLPILTAERTGNAPKTGEVSHDRWSGRNLLMWMV